MSFCVFCGTQFMEKDVGRPRQFCSERCRNQTWLHKYKQRKNEILTLLGGKCVKCGISDYRLLDVDHIKPKLNCSQTYKNNTKIEQWMKELDNLQLLCANCHRLKTLEDNASAEGTLRYWRNKRAAV